ncbi:MAG: 50S ribosomal protein L29 [Fimbriimonadales bacterium]
MKDLKMSELREKSVADLESLLASERAGLFQLKKRLAFKEEKDVRSAVVQRHNIARILTVISEKDRAGTK